MKRHIYGFISVVMIIFSLCLFGCDGSVDDTLPETEIPEENVPEENVPEVEVPIVKVPELVISRVYIPEKGQAKFFAVTNTSSRDVDLSAYCFAMDNTSHEKTQKFPPAVLAAGKTLFCPNGFLGEKQSDLDYFKSTFPVIASLPEYTSGIRIDEDSVWYGIKGYYKGESSMEIVTDVNGSSWTTVDEAAVAGASPKKPSAILRTWDETTGEDLGWFVLDPSSKTDRKALETGIYDGESVKPGKPDTDKPEGGRPDQGGGTVPNPNNPSGNGASTSVDNVMLGYPDAATFNDPKGENNYRVEYDAYTLSYNNTDHNPNWVSWHLTKDDMGGPRHDAYHSEKQLPNEWTKVESGDYKSSGYSKGHMCPSGERSKNRDRQYETFSMANMVPQLAANNSGPWNKLENALRGDCNSGKEAYIVCGPYGNMGTIGKGVDIVIPEYTWKVALVIDRGENDLDRINNGISVEAVAVWMPNFSGNRDDKPGVSSGDAPEKWGVSIDYVEEMTGYDFFAFIDDDIENAIEAQKWGY